MPIFLRVLEEGEPQYITEHSMQITRKLILEILHRLPTNECLRSHVKAILSVMFKLLEVENEDNVLVCLRIIIELHKQFRPPFNTEISKFLVFVKSIYRELPNQLEKIFEPREGAIRVQDITEVSMDTLLNETFTTTVVQVGAGDGEFDGKPLTWFLAHFIIPSRERLSCDQTSSIYLDKLNVNIRYL